MKNFCKFVFLSIIIAGCGLSETIEFQQKVSNGNNIQTVPYFEFSSKIYTDSSNFYYRWVKSGDTCFNSLPDVRLILPPGNYSRRKFECRMIQGTDTIYRDVSTRIDSSYICSFVSLRARLPELYRVFGIERLNSNKEIPIAEATLILRFPKR